MKTIENRVYTVIEHIMEPKKGSMNLMTTLDDLEADSLDQVEIILRLEDEFNIDISEEQAEKFKCIGDVVLWLENKEKAAKKKTEPKPPVDDDKYIKLKQELDRCKHLMHSMAKAWEATRQDTDAWETMHQILHPFFRYINENVPLPEKFESPALIKAEDDEPIFVLRAHDKLAHFFVRQWAVVAKEKGLSQVKYDEVMAIADRMKAWPNQKLPD